MAVFLAFLVVFLAMAGYSNAAYCICKDGVSNDQLQKDIDYACGDGADCNPIHETGSCYSPITVKDHCNYAVNSYFQRKGQIAGSCDFSGTAVISQTVPNAVNGCVYPSSPSNAGTATPTNPSTAPAPPGTTTNPPVTVTPTNPGIAPPGSTNPGTPVTPGTNPGIAPPGSTNPGTNTPTNPLIAPPGSIVPVGGGGGANMPGFGGLGPTGINPDNTLGDGVSTHHGLTSFGSLALSGVVFGLIWFGF